jgi:hypothetical protein
MLFWLVFGLLASVRTGYHLAGWLACSRLEWYSAAIFVASWLVNTSSKFASDLGKGWCSFDKVLEDAMSEMTHFA